MLPLASKTNAAEIAARIAAGLGVGPVVIGLSIVAIGTSLPELATAVAAGLRGRGDVALGNVIGSNIFNLLGIVGVAALVGPLTVPDRIAGLDLWVLWAVTLALAPLALAAERCLGRGGVLLIEGAALLDLQYDVAEAEDSFEALYAEVLSLSLDEPRVKRVLALSTEPVKLVDEAGNETSFTSLGSVVDLYANGEKTMDQAIADFTAAVKEFIPNITVELEG